MKKTMIKAIAQTLQAYQSCLEKGNSEWIRSHRETLRKLEKLLPYGSGIDCGTKIDLEESTPECIVLTLSYHHMDENGSYDGWTDHTIKCTASLVFDINLDIDGEDRNDTIDYLQDVYGHALTNEVDISK